MNQSAFDHLLEKYQKGLTTPEENDRVEQWLRSMNYSQGFTWSKRDEERQFAAIRKRIKDTSGRVYFYQTMWFKVAAAVSVFFLVVFFITNEIEVINTVSITTREGETKKVLLTDGTIVWIKPGSTLKYPQEFNTKLRHVQLNGEALFEVAKDPEHPFVVQCGEFLARVKGTSFNLRINAREIELMVLTGQVELASVKTNAKSVLVPANRRVTVSNENVHQEETVSQHEKQKRIDNTDYDMAFSNASVQTIFKRMERKFDMQVHCNNQEMRGCLITADFTDLSLEDTLRMMAHILDFNYEITSHTVMVSGGRCE